MEFNRNHYFMAGVIVLLLGVQIRTVKAYVLNEQATKIVDKVAKPPAQESSAGPFFVPNATPQRRVVRPPEWLGYALLSVGGVLVLHSLAMCKPGG